MTHSLDPQLLERPIRILVVGCGGNGSAIVSGLPYLHQAMLAFGHPGGLQVTLIDPDTVSETNCVRQPFCRTEIGFPKAIVLAHRINLFWGLNWQGMQAQIQQVAKNAALTRQEPFINQNLAYQALGMLTQLLRHGYVSYQGGFCNLVTGHLVPWAVGSPQQNCRR